MENIARTLARRIRDEVRLGDVLKLDFEAARRLVQEAGELLRSWSSEYFSVRRKIEDSGSDHR